MQYAMSLIFPAAAALLFIACNPSQKITNRQQLRIPNALGRLMILSQDSSLFEFDTYLLHDSLLSGKGEWTNRGVTRKTDTTLELSDIRYIQARPISGWTGWVIAAASGAALAWSLSALGGGNGLNVTEHFARYDPYAPSGESCPFISSWDGVRFRLEAEAISVALGKAMEISTVSVLPSLVPDGGVLRVRVSNERTETHYINSVTMLAVAHEPGTRVLADTRDRFWQVAHPEPPLAARDHGGADVALMLAQVDGRRWESDCMRSDPKPRGYRDAIELVFARSPGAAEASLVVEAINTEISGAAFAGLYGLLGRQSLAFIDAAERDPAVIRALQQTLDDASLRVEVWNGRAWVRRDALLPEANVVPFARIARIPVLDAGSNVLRVRLSCLSDVWKLDAVTVDWTRTRPLPVSEVPLLRAQDPSGTDLRHLLRADDESYAVMFPPQYLEFSCKALPPRPGKQTAYALRVGGYLHEWIRESDNLMAVMAGVLSDEQRLDFARSMLFHRERMLPIVYAEWREMNR